ncbi:MAG: DUF3696 domain-containing protein [Dehalococcoidia bacterium]|nr:DUF3696 domain-containing protein [Dehalococcoidia bacterium]
MRDYEWSTRLMLNGSLAKLGTVTDVVDQVTGRGSFEVGLRDQDMDYRWRFSGDRQDMSLEVNLVKTGNSVRENPTELRFLLPVDARFSHVSLVNRIRNLTYITAEREGPRETYPLEDQHAVRVVGPRGENAVTVLYGGRDEHIATELMLEGVAPTLLHQLGARLASFFPDCAIDVQQVPNANAVTLGIRTSSDTGFLRPIHCGFGITQILPIIVATLSVSKGSLMLIENPEVHLHPAGQALMGQLLADAAHAGIQTIVETHSDHVLNGIRRSVKSERILADEVAIHFFRQRSQDAAQVLSPTLDSSGNIDVWPEGFFDQFDKDMDYFVGWGK